MQIQIRQTSPTSSQATIRGHKVAIDRPPDKGGSDDGPMGGELLLASIGGCFMSNLLAAVRARNAEVSGIQTEVIATLAEAPTRFARIELCVTGDYKDAEAFQHLVEIAERGCIMVNTLKGKLDLHIRIAARV